MITDLSIALVVVVTSSVSFHTVFFRVSWTPGRDNKSVDPFYCEDLLISRVGLFLYKGCLRLDGACCWVFMIRQSLCCDRGGTAGVHYVAVAGEVVS